MGELDGTRKRIRVELLWFHSQIVIVMAGDEKSLHSTWLCISLASSKPIVCCLCRPTLLLLLANLDLWPHFWAKTPNCLGCLGYEVLPPADFHGNFSQGFDSFPTESISQTACPTRIFHSFNYSTSPPESLFKKKDHVTQQNLLVFSVQKRSKSLNHQAVVFSINKNIDELRNLILAVRLLAMYWTSKFELLRGCSVPKRFSHVLALSATQWVQERVIFDLHPTFGSERMNVLII